MEWNGINITLVTWHAWNITVVYSDNVDAEHSNIVAILDADST